MKIRKRLSDRIDSSSFTEEEIRDFIEENINTLFSFRYYQRKETGRIVGYNKSNIMFYFIVEPINRELGWDVHSTESSSNYLVEAKKGWYVTEVYTI